MRRSIFALVAASMLAACNHLPVTLSQDSESRQVVELIAAAHAFAGLQGEDQKRELNAANQSFAKERSAYARVRVALLLSLPGTAVADEARAMTVLEPLLSGTGGGATQTAALRQFAGLLYAEVGERVREQRKSAQLREQSAQLKEQLDALRAIERSIIERGKAK